MSDTQESIFFHICIFKSVKEYFPIFLPYNNVNVLTFMVSLKYGVQLLDIRGEYIISVNRKKKSCMHAQFIIRYKIVIVVTLWKR